MLPPAALEENILKVLEWLNQDHDRYPVVGQRAMDAAKALDVSFAEVNVANRRIRFGIANLQEPKPKLIKSVKTDTKTTAV